MIIRTGALLVYLIFSSMVYSQDTEDRINDFSPYQPLQKAFDINRDINIFFDDGLSIVKAPFSFSSTEIYITGAVAALSGIAFLSDSKIQSTVLKNQNKVMDNATWVGEKYGRSLIGGLLGSGLYLTGALLDNNDISSSGRMVVESVIYSGLTVGILKYAFSRGRPYENEGNSDYFDFTFKEADVSLPSGHTATAFAVSTVLSRQIDNVYATIGLYSLAGLTAYQRMYDNKHWFSDVVVGAALGYFIGNTIANSEKGRENDESFLSKVNLMPSVNSKGIGLSLNMNF